MKCGNSAGRYGVEVLMCNCVSPVNQLLKQFAPAFVPSGQSINLRPKIDAQSVEIRTDGARVRIAPAQASIPDKLRAQETFELRWDYAYNLIDALRVKIPTEALEVR
jgi:hypothetical protein